MVTSKVGAICVAGLLAAALLSCGDDDDGGDGGGGPSGGGSYGSIASNLEKPSGTLAATNAVDVAEAYEKMGAGDGDKRRKQAGTQTIACDAGGTQKVEAAGVTQTSVTAKVTYDDCCHQQGCCMDGDADWFYASQGAGDYPYCGRYDVTSTCGGAPQKLSYEGCFSTTGWVFLVKVDGKSYAVTGFYADGNGELTIKDSTASWTCTYQSAKGTCTGGAAPISF